MGLVLEKQIYIPPPNTTAFRLMETRDKILATWVALVKQSVSSKEQEPIIVNAIPALLENLAQALDQSYPRQLATEGTNLASEHGGERARITRFTPSAIRLESSHGRAIITVHNFGPHIPVEEQETLFRSFMRTKAAQTGHKTGWGLGLAMVRGMTEGHGGSITLDSAPERGTTFIIDVPIDSRPHLAHPITPGA